MFSYTLPPEEDKFYIDTEQLGNQLYGYLRVRDSSLLDYENKSQITVTVSGNCNQMTLEYAESFLMHGSESLCCTNALENISNAFEKKSLMKIVVTR